MVGYGLYILLTECEVQESASDLFCKGWTFVVSVAWIDRHSEEAFDIYHGLSLYYICSALGEAWPIIQLANAWKHCRGIRV